MSISVANARIKKIAAGRMRGPFNPLRDCIPAASAQKRFCRRVANGTCRFPRSKGSGREV